MRKLLVLLFVGVISHLSTGSYTASKDKTCRSECKRDEQCDLGYACIRDGCRFICVRKVLPNRSIIADPLTLPSMKVASIPRGDVVGPHDGNVGQVVGGVVDVDTGMPITTDYPKDKTCRSECKRNEQCDLGYACVRDGCRFICVRKVLPNISIIADPLTLPSMKVASIPRGDVVGPHDGNAGQVVGGVVDVDTGMPITTDYPKDKTCRSECKRNEQCDLGYACIRDGCRFICVRKVLPNRSIIADPLTLPRMMVASIPRGDVVGPHDGNDGQVVGGVFDVDTGLPITTDYPKDKTCRSECKRNEQCDLEYACIRDGCRFICVRKVLPNRSIIADPLTLPRMMVASIPRGDVVGPHDGNDGQVVGGVFDVDTGLPVTTDYPKDKNIPIPSPDASNSKSKFPEAVPVGPGLGFNDILFICIDHCVASTACVEGTDCVLGCKNMCENEQSSIHISPENPSAGMAIGNGPVNSIDTLTPVRKIDSYGKKDLLGQNAALINQQNTPAVHVDINGQLTPIDSTSSQFPVKKQVIQQYDVKPIVNYATTDLPNNKDIVPGEHLIIDPALPLDSMNKGYPIGNGPINPIGKLTSVMPIGSNVNVDQHLIIKSALPVDSVGHVTQVGTNGARFYPHVPSSKGNTLPIDLGMQINSIQPIDSIHQRGSGQFESNIPNIAHDNFVPPPFDLPVGVNSNGQIELIDQSIRGIEHGNRELPVHVGRNIPLRGLFESNIPNIPHDNFVPPPFDLPVGVNYNGQIELINQSIRGIEHGNPDLPVHVGSNIPLRGQFESNIPNIPDDNYVPPPFDLPVDVNYNGQTESIDQSIRGIEHGNPDLPVHVGRNIPLRGQFESNIPNISDDNYVPPPFDLPVDVNYNGQTESIDQSIRGIEHGNPDLPVHVGRNIPLRGQFESNIPNIPHDNYVPPPFDLPVDVNYNGQIESIDQSIRGIEHGIPDWSVQVGRNIPLRPNKNLIPVAPRNCYKECNRDIHCGPQKVCVEKGCKRVCLPVLPIEPIVPNTNCIDQCISNQDCHSGMVCERRPCRNICIKHTLKNDYKA